MLLSDRKSLSRVTAIYNGVLPRPNCPLQAASLSSMMWMLAIWDVRLPDLVRTLIVQNARALPVVSRCELATFIYPEVSRVIYRFRPDMSVDVVVSWPCSLRMVVRLWIVVLVVGLGAVVWAGPVGVSGMCDGEVVWEAAGEAGIILVAGSGVFG